MALGMKVYFNLGTVKGTLAITLERDDFSRFFIAVLSFSLEGEVNFMAKVDQPVL